MNYLFIFGVFLEFLRTALSQVPDYETTTLLTTSFSCNGRKPGYYADLETGCRTYHVCDGISHFAYTCPKRTLFRQSGKICDHYYLVDCAVSFDESDDFYHSLEEQVNREYYDLALGKSEENILSKGDESENVKNEEEETNTTETVESIETTTVVEPETTTTRTTESSSTSETTMDPSKTEKTLKLKLKDFRSLFFIPEPEDNSVLTKTVKELMLTVDGSEFFRFKSKPEVEEDNVNGFSSPCPSYCDPDFVFPGTCHPCLMIK